MPYDGFGNFTRSYSWAADKLASIKIQAVRMDGEFDNFSTAMNAVLLRNGAAACTGDFKLGGNKLTGIGAGSAASPSIQYSADATTGIYFPAAGVVGLSAAGALRFAANNTGAYVPVGQLFGIGTATPRTGLDVAAIASFRSAFEDVLISGSAITGTVNIDVLTSSVVMLTANAAGNFVFNFRGDGTTSLNSIMGVGQACTVCIEVPLGVTGYYCTNVLVDGAAVASLKWFGTAPTAGDASAINTYTFTITKTAGGVFQVRASKARVV